MRGEDLEDVKGLNKRQGSPPHARGRLEEHYDYELIAGITPACAGKTRRGAACRSGSRDHPRMRGEDSPAGWIFVESMDHPRMRGEDSRTRNVPPCLSGSPPHARGRRRYLTRAEGQSRITPACAGKTSWSGRTSWCRSGSPPHARGRLRGETVEWDAVRITPACAGKTCVYARVCVCVGDHPRMRGEDSGIATFRIDYNGSPPHARGRLGLGR